MLKSRVLLAISHILSGTYVQTNVKEDNMDTRIHKFEIKATPIYDTTHIEKYLIQKSKDMKNQDKLRQKFANKCFNNKLRK